MLGTLLTALIYEVVIISGAAVVVKAHNKSEHASKTCEMLKDCGIVRNKERTLDKLFVYEYCRCFEADRYGLSNLIEVCWSTIKKSCCHKLLSDLDEKYLENFKEYY